MSDSNPILSRSPLRRPAAIAIVGAAILGTSLWLSFRQPGDTVTLPSAPAKQSAMPTPQPVPAPQPDAAGKPSFDIVRVNPQGDAVIAGRAAPNADVAVVANGREIGHTKADERGQWVVVPDTKLTPGGQQLTLTSREPDGRETKGDAPVLLVVPAAPAPTYQHVQAGNAGPPPPAAPPAPIAVLIPPNAPPRLLQSPSPASNRPGGSDRLGLDAVDYDEQGQIRFSGTAAPGATIRLYVDNRAVGDTQANARNGWSMVPKTAIAAGEHHLRLDQLGPTGKVTARIELPFERAKPARIAQAVAAGGTAMAVGQIVVQPGQSLWRISRNTYGLGIQYVTIYEANRDQIRDPNWIYPGQVFAVPAKPAATANGGATPVSSSTSR